MTTSQYTGSAVRITDDRYSRAAVP